MAKAKGRTLAEFGVLSKAERLLLEKAAEGEFADVSFRRPESMNDDNRLRPTFIRFLLLGGSEAPVHEHGVQLQGGWIEGDLDLEGVESLHVLKLLDCRIDGNLIIYDARLRRLNLDGSSLRGIQGDRTVIAGGALPARGVSRRGRSSLA